MSRFETAISGINPRIKKIVQSLSEEYKEQLWEIRLRSNAPIVLLGQFGTAFINESGRVSRLYTGTSVLASQAEVNDSFTRLCGYSVHSHCDDIANGFITIEGGHRAGICGTAILEHGNIASVRDISSINLRIARENKEAAAVLQNRLYKDGLVSVIIAGPPTSGKTTMLRDLARRLSSGMCQNYYKTSIADERGEIAAVYRGIPGNDVGLNCDVLTSYPKGEAIQTALRSLSPEIIICDEVGAMEEISAIEAGLNSGVKFAVTVHASSFEELTGRPQIKKLLRTFAFDYLVLLSGGLTPCRISKIYETEELINEIGRNYIDSDILCNAGTIPQ